MLTVSNLQTAYGAAQVLFDISFAVGPGEVVTLLGRNGMGKTTTVNTIMGLVPPRGGEIVFEGRALAGLAPYRIAQCGIGLVPEGRQVFPTLSVHENLVATAAARSGPPRWTLERVYELFPRLKERSHHLGSQLSGGEQQMLAIGRAMLLEPRLLVMDEPTEGLAPVIVDQVAQALRDLAAEGEIAVLLIEQNLGVAMSVADRIGVMVNGRIARELSAAELGSDVALQERLLGLRSTRDDEEADAADASVGDAAGDGTVQVLTVRRAHAEGAPTLADLAPRSVRGFNRWNAADGGAPVVDIARTASAPADSTGLSTPAWSDARDPVPLRPVEGSRALYGPGDASARSTPAAAQVFDFPVSASSAKAAYVAGTFDTKGRE
ncbi:MAG: ABC transporter ATP-binding protein, partial [Microvirga sp.]